jgi:hypothetical protein
MENVDKLAALFRKNGIEPKEVTQLDEGNLTDAGVDIDGVYSISIAEYEKKPYMLSKWTEGNTIMKWVGDYATPQEAVDRYMLDVKYRIK